MPRSPDGSYSLPNGTIVNSGDTLLPSQHNPAMQDIASALSSSLDRDGSGGMRAPLDMGGFSVRNAGAGSLSSDLATIAQATGAGVPVGTIIDYAGAVAPTNYLLCYGQAVSRTDYAELFAAIGTTYGSGNGATTFNVPDCRGRAVAGKDDMGGVSANRITAAINGDILGAAGGAETHTLTIAEMPSHDHGDTGSAGAHQHYLANNTTSGTSLVANEYVSRNGSASGDSEYSLKSNTVPADMGLTSSSGAHVHDIPAQGSGQAHNNVQPTIIFNKCIKCRSA